MRGLQYQTMYTKRPRRFMKGEKGRRVPLPTSSTTYIIIYMVGVYSRKGYTQCVFGLSSPA